MAMTRAWEREKEYRIRRSADLTQEMDLAILSGDKARFQRAFDAASGYMSRKDLAMFLTRFSKSMMGRRCFTR